MSNQEAFPCDSSQAIPPSPPSFFTRTCSRQHHRILLIPLPALLLILVAMVTLMATDTLLQSNLQTRNDIHQFHSLERIPSVRTVSRFSGLYQVERQERFACLTSVGWLFCLYVTIKCSRSYRLHVEEAGIALKFMSGLKRAKWRVLLKVLHYVEGCISAMCYI